VRIAQLLTIAATHSLELALHPLLSLSLLLPLLLLLHLLEQLAHRLQLLLFLLLPLLLHARVLLVPVLSQSNGYFQLVLRLLGEEVAQDVEVRPVLLQQDTEQLDLFTRPHLRLLFVFGLVTAGHGICVAETDGRFGLGLFLRKEKDTAKSMESIREASVCFWGN
jgi:hypothetical protein